MTNLLFFVKYYKNHIKDIFVHSYVNVFARKLTVSIYYFVKNVLNMYKTDIKIRK